MTKRITETELGPQYKGDNSFQKEARLLQSLYRLEKLGEVTFGVGPMRNSMDKSGNPTRYGNMLVNGESTGKNFILASTFAYAQNRVKNKLPEETIDAYRLFNNMLSSMPLCFNLFHPLMEILEKDSPAATHLVRSLFPDLPIEKVSKIDLEFIPTPIHNYLGDKTALDAVVFFEDDAGSKFMIAIETKYTEALGKNGPSTNGKHLHFAQSSDLFTQTGIKDIETCCSQIFRNFLLTEKYRVTHGIHESFSVILAPDLNLFTGPEVARLKESVKESYHYKIRHYSLESFVNTIKQNCSPSYRKWIDDFHDRYLNFLN